MGPAVILRRIAKAVFSAAAPSMAVIQARYDHESRIEFAAELDRVIWGDVDEPEATKELVGLAAFW